MHNVSNILAAIAAAISLGIGRDAIIQGVESVSAVPGRLEAVDAGQPFKVFVDFAHTEDALFNILSLLRDVAEQRIVTVFGCGGNRDRTKRPRMGKVACRFSDHVIITSDNPRFEEPQAIVEEIECGVKGEFSNYDIVVDRKEAISKALTLARRNDIIVIAGKGHESYQIVRDAVMPFDDREVALGMLNTIKIQKSKVKTGGSLPRP
jgi:UDP-N-acetylmuramyl-tripeptide synthetase